MSTAVEIMQKFMQTLDDTTSSGTTALDEAVRACSGFSGIQDLIDSFLEDCTAASSADTFLSSYCGILLSNEDTGAISGSDAGGTTTKTASSIVAESGTAVYPSGSSSIIDGVTVIWPTQHLTSTEEIVLADLNSWWISSALSLIKESYGLSFTEDGVSTTTLKVQFYNQNDSTLASTGSGTDSAGNSYLTLNINMYYYRGITSGDTDGVTSSTGTSQALDRVIAHELVHALMVSTMSCFDSLPEFITEGTAELVQGVDDKWTSVITALASDTTALESALDLSDTGSGNSTAYAAGYMLLRYLAQQAAASPSTAAATAASWPGSEVTYDSSCSTVLVGAGFSGRVELNARSGVSYADTVTTLDASSANGTVQLVGWGTTATTIIGGSGVNDIWGGGSSNDTIQCGSGTDTVWYGTAGGLGDGSDTVTGFTSNQDTLYIYDGYIREITLSGSNLILGVGTADTTTGSVTVADGAARELTLNLMGTIYKAWYAREDQASTVTWSENLNYYLGASGYTTTLAVTGSSDAAVRLDNTSAQVYYRISTIDASASSGKDTLVGSSSSDTILMGSGSSEVWGGLGGSDTFQCGSGADRIWYGVGDGQDTITNGASADSVYFYDTNTIDDLQFSLSGTTLQIAKAGGSVLSLANWSASGLNTFELAGHSKYSLSVSAANTITVKQTS